ncbi:alpha/beta fold hydrolase [Cryptosporangium phraense]|uniref:alpha/beta hydrolase family protein n=1 Tax=Cryptosporangium phraense TaxID=2593070 RepID=UPI00197AD548
MGVVATLNSGGLIDEVDRACRPIREAASKGEDAGTPDFLRAWTALTDQLVAQTEDASKAGHERTARQLYRRATNYLCQAERMLANSDESRIPTYRRVLELQERAFPASVERVAVPYLGTTLPAYFSAAPGDGPHPVIVLVNGLDSTKEHQYSSGHWEELAARGISCLMLDQPGSGEALRLQGLTARIDAEAWGSAALDHLSTRSDVDPSRIGIVGWSLGGYYAPRVAAFEKRYALCVAWGANHNWGAVQRRRWGRGPADTVGVRAPVVRPGGQRAAAGAAGVHARRGRDQAHWAGSPPARQHVHRRLGRGPIRHAVARPWWRSSAMRLGHPLSVHSSFRVAP